MATKIHTDAPWPSEVAYPGSRNSDIARQFFISQLHVIVGHERMRLLWLPNGSDTTTTTSADRYARTITYDATIAARLSALGMGYAVSFSGSGQYASTPDVDALSFGDGLNDQAFSIFALVNVTNTAAVKQMLSKYDLTTGVTKREWAFFLETAEQGIFTQYDESLAGRIGRYKNSAVTLGSWVLLSATYDGTRANSSSAVYQNTTKVDDTAYGSGTYAAMENTAGLVYLGASVAAGGTATDVFAGSMAVVGLCSRQLQPDDLWAIVTLCNWYYNLSLAT